MSKPDNKTFVAGIFKRYELSIRKFLLGKRHQKEDVEDLVQETFLKAHRVSDWTVVKNPEAFLVRIASNTHKDHLRKQRRNMVDRTEDISEMELESEKPTPEQLVSRMEDIKELERTVDSLTPRVKEAIILIKILNLSYAEASDIMKVSVSTVETHVTKGVAECRKKLTLREPTHDRRLSVNKVISLSEHKTSHKDKN